MTELLTRRTDDHYIQVYLPGHTQSDRCGWVMEHRVIYERHLGHALPKGTVVHHLDLCRWNNVIENLLLCPSQDLHLALHRAMRGSDQTMVGAFIDWFRSLEIELRKDRSSLTTSPTEGADEPQPLFSAPPELNPEGPLNLSPAWEQLYRTVDTIASISNKEERIGFLSPLLEHVSRVDLLDVLASRLISASPSEALRIIWTIGVLGIEEAGLILQVVVSSSQDKNQRRLAWSALAKRHYRSVDPEVLRDSILRERGQALLYGVKAVACNCPREFILEILDQVDGMDLPPKQRVVIAESTGSYRRKLQGPR